MKEKYSIIRSADRYIELRQYKKAIKVYQSLIDSGERDPSIINNLGDLQYRNGDQASALKNYSQAANIYSDSGDALKAVGICRKILRIDPFDDDILNLILDLNQRREASFDSKGILSDLVKTAGEGEHFGRAAILQDRLISIGDKDPASHVRLGEFRFLAGLKDQAAESVHKSLDLFPAKTSAPDRWDWITGLIASRNCTEDFQQFVANLKTGYIPSGSDTVPQAVDILPEDESPPPLPAVEDALNLPEFFEVDGSLDLEEDLLETVESAEDVATGFDFSKEVDGAALFGTTSEIADAGEEPEEEAWTPDGISSMVEEEGSGEGEEAQEFEFNLDEGELSRSPEELLEMLEADIQAEEKLGADEAAAVEDLKEEYSPAVDDEYEEDEGFELNLDKEDFSVDYSALGIEDLDEPVGEDKEPEIPSADDEIETALEGLFVSPGQQEDYLANVVPEGVPEQEYLVADAEKKHQDEDPSGDAPASDPDDDPDVQVELGIAYRDMALLEDAIGKFENALEIFEGQGETDKCVLCCQLLAECCNSLELFRETLKWVARGLDYRKVSEDEIVYFEYESAVALESLGDYSESLRGFRRIQSIHPGFRDVESRISGMESAGH
ncbi:MAG: hypothetical protein ABIJ42_09425 [Acidobacteriota bacterium]